MQSTQTVPIIQTKQQHQQALERVDLLIRQDKPDNNPEIEALGLMIENYERKIFPFVPADPVALVDYRMKSLGMKASELAKRMSVAPSHLSAVLNRRRHMSKEMIRGITSVLGISPGLLIQDYRLATDEVAASALKSRAAHLTENSQ